MKKSTAKLQEERDIPRKPAIFMICADSGGSERYNGLRRRRS